MRSSSNDESTNSIIDVTPQHNRVSDNNQAYNSTIQKVTIPVNIQKHSHLSQNEIYRLMEKGLFRVATIEEAKRNRIYGSEFID